MWAGLRHSVYELGVTNVGGVSRVGMYWALRVWARFCQCLCVKLINLGEVSSGRGLARARFRHLVYEISFTRVWARFRQLVDEMSLTNMGKVLPVLMSGAVKFGRGFAGLFMRRV